MNLFLFNFFLCYFRLELNGHRRRLTWEATPRSIHEGMKYLFNFQSKSLKQSVLPLITFNNFYFFFAGVSSAIMNSDCLVFDTTIAQLFADNGNLGINVTISMCWTMLNNFFALRFGFTLYSFDINWLIISDLVI